MKTITITYNNKMNDWKKCRLGDACVTNTYTYSPKENWEFVNYLDTGNITDNRIDSIQYIDVQNEKLPSRARRKVKTNSIIYSTVRPNQRHFGIIKTQPENFLVSTGFAVIDVNDKVLNPDFVYYSLTQDTIVKKLHAIAEQSTSAYPSIKPSDIEDLEIDIPDIETQKKIAGILRCLDDKIELNNRINANLELQAQAIFQSWFVDFEPFGGKMPKEWRKGTVSDLSKEIICGKTPTTKKKEYYGDYMPFITIPDMHNCIYVISTERYLSELGVNSQIKKTLPKNSICVSCIGTAGLVVLVSVDSQTNQQINSIIPKEDYSPYYIYLYMQTLSEKINRLGQSGSTIVNLNKAQFGLMEALVPSVDTMKDFDIIAKPLFELILTNQQENQCLATLRDALLPKLMSGEINVSAVTI